MSIQNKEQARSSAPVTNDEARSSAPVIFQYEQFSGFFADWLDFRRSADRSFSHTVFAKSIGLESPPLIAMIARGRRTVTPKTLQKLLKGLKLNEFERTYAETLVAHERAGSHSEGLTHLRKLQAMRQFVQTNTGDLAPFDHLVQWQYQALYRLAEDGRLTEDIRQTIALLGFRVDSKVVASSLRRLLFEGYLVKGDDGRLMTGRPFGFEDDLPPKVTTLYSAMVLREASLAFTQGDHDPSLGVSKPLRIPEHRLAEAANLLKGCLREIEALAETEPGGKTFHVCLQIFR